MMASIGIYKLNMGRHFYKDWFASEAQVSRNSLQIYIHGFFALGSSPSL
jgi:hypothetical protein